MLVTSLEMCKAMQGRRRVDELVVEEVEDWESSHNSSPADRSAYYHRHSLTSRGMNKILTS